MYKNKMSKREDLGPLFYCNKVYNSATLVLQCNKVEVDIWIFMLLMII